MADDSIPFGFRYTQAQSLDRSNRKAGGCKRDGEADADEPKSEIEPGLGKERCVCMTRRERHSDHDTKNIKLPAEETDKQASHRPQDKESSKMLTMYQRVQEA